MGVRAEGLGAMRLWGMKFYRGFWRDAIGLLLGGRGFSLSIHGLAFSVSRLRVFLLKVGSMLSLGIGLLGGGCRDKSSSTS